MPIERPQWRGTELWRIANQQLSRLMDVLALSDRVGVVVANSSQTVPLTVPLTLVTADTAAGNVTLTLPDPRTVPGFRCEIKKLTAANTLTVASAALIDGATTLAWTTQYQSFSFISDGSTYHVV